VVVVAAVTNQLASGGIDGDIRRAAPYGIEVTLAVGRQVDRVVWDVVFDQVDRNVRQDLTLLTPWNPEPRWRSS